MHTYSYNLINSNDKERTVLIMMSQTIVVSKDGKDDYVVLAVAKSKRNE